MDPDAGEKHWWKDPDGVEARLAALRGRLAEASWDEPALEEALRGLADDLGVGAGKLIHPLRVALTGQGASPGIFEVLVLLGRDTGLARLERALERLRAGHESLS